jgi:NAD+ synthase (glutamine-hydrolysing)
MVFTGCSLDIKMNSLTLLMAQINPTVGAIQTNTDKIISIISEHQSQHDIIVFPELCLCGYPPEDLLLHEQFYTHINKAVDQITQQVKQSYVIIGHPILHNNIRFNAASILHQGKIILTYHKQHLPNHGVFDEKRYFQPGKPHAAIFTVKNHSIGICICEDLWQDGPVELLAQNGAEVVLCLNASPFDQTKYQQRIQRLSKLSQLGISLVYVNQTGGQDELVFDGQSLAIDKSSKLCARSEVFSEHLHSLTYTNHTFQGHITPLLDLPALIYKALTLGLSDYIHKNNFKSVVLGLSGGIDSALTLAIAVDAIGPTNVHVVMLPSRYNAEESLVDAIEQANTMHVAYSILPIEPAFQVFLDSLSELFANKPADVTEENLQARIRGIMLMAISNKTGALLLSTSNKSESATGYSTLYGDMCGGFAPLKDVLKTMVYQLAHYRNQNAEVIPNRVLTKPPSAELAPNQKDQDSLPDYAILDSIITAFVEQKSSLEDIVSLGYDKALVQRIIKLIQRNEYKRRQAPPGLKITSCAFDKDWRYPITYLEN